MGWLVFNNLAWIAGLLVYNYFRQDHWQVFSQYRQALESLSQMVPSIIKEANDGINRNLYPRTTNRADNRRADDSDLRHVRQALDEVQNDDLGLPWESDDALFGFATQGQIDQVDGDTDKWVMPTVSNNAG